jgi:hypothetical protein
MILDALKKRLYRENDKAPRRWLKELPVVVWGLRTQPNRNTGTSPYFMVYGAEAVCDRTDRIIRAQVQKQAPKRSNFLT